MSDSLQTLRVFIASPSDLEEERKAIKNVADSLNATFGREANWHIQLLGWEDTLPGFGRPQALINEDVDRSDLFIGFLWRWWGSATGHQEYSSGFEEEFYRALKRREQTGIPEMCVFFKEVDAASLKDPGEHLQKILDFKSGLIESKKLLFQDFNDIVDWKERTRNLLETHLLRFIKRESSSQLQSQPQQPSEQKATDLCSTSGTLPSSRMLSDSDVWRFAARLYSLAGRPRKALLGPDHQLLKTNVTIDCEGMMA